MVTSSLKKLLNELVKIKFPFINRIEVFEDKPAFDLPWTTVYVILNRYEDIKYDKEIREYIEEISMYSGTKINQISFSLEGS
jgi:hypothetical protein